MSNRMKAEQLTNYTTHDTFNFLAKGSCSFERIFNVTRSVNL